jgi:hypothetical protein
MVAPVVLDDEAGPGIVEVGPAQETAVCVAKVDLDFWVRQASLQQKPAESSFHWRLRGLRKCGYRAQTA